MPGDCSLDVQNEAQTRVLRLLLFINALMFLVELGAGIYADSAGVLADSLDMFADALVYGVSIYAVGKCANTKRRAARLGGYFQLILAICILLELVRKIVGGSEPQSVLMFVVSVVALCANAFCFYELSKQKAEEAHMRASWIFTRTDVIANAGVILAAVMVALLKSPWPDLVIGGAILFVVLQGSYQILKENRKVPSFPPKKAIEEAPAAVTNAAHRAEMVIC